eukprot:m.205419 g.205419  ORF g.205419 m.205419 type:complete len:377 (-) comp17759_c1_seq2:705-1835(-)
MMAAKGKKGGVRVRDLRPSLPGLKEHEASQQFDDEEEAGGAINVREVGLVIPASFFAEARKECGLDLLPTPNTILPSHATGSFSAKTAWKSALRSPLGSFLTGVRNKYPWVQLAGHRDNFIQGPAGTICKKSCDGERAALEELMMDELKPMVPLFYKPVMMNDSDDMYLEMQDLLAGFQNPSVMDVKMGVRTFLESEVSKKEKRMDLLEKMIDVDANEPTEEERKTGITKLRYMMFRERLSSTKTLGFRIEGIKLANEEPKSHFKMVQTKEQVRETLMSFLPPQSTALHNVVRERLLTRLRALRETLGRSQFFWTHEFVGSSLLFVYDNSGRACVWMIDFGKTVKVDGVITHSTEWVLGNREDGYLLGLDNLLDLM